MKPPIFGAHRNKLRASTLAKKSQTPNAVETRFIPLEMVERVLGAEKRKRQPVLRPVAMAAGALIVATLAVRVAAPGPQPSANPAPTGVPAPHAPVPSAAMAEPAGPPSAPSAATSPPAPQQGDDRAGGVTLERRAADLVAGGDYADAVNLYGELAANHPERTVYAEARRILTAKAAARAESVGR
jgi:hypothetical protein